MFRKHCIWFRMHGSSALCVFKVYLCKACFIEGREYVKDDAWRGHPSSMETDCRTSEHWQGCRVCSAGATFVKEKTLRKICSSHVNDRAEKAMDCIVSEPSVLHRGGELKNSYGRQVMALWEWSCNKATACSGWGKIHQNQKSCSTKNPAWR